MADGELVRRAQRGDRSACERLVRHWSAASLAWCHAHVSNRHTAEDLAQETLYRGLRAINTLADPEKFGPWLRGIARRVCWDWLKSRQSSQVPFSMITPDGSPDALTSTGDDAQRAVDRADDIAQLMAAVESLSDQYREVLMIYYYQEVTYADMAEMLGVSTATINARLTKARTALREQLRRSEERKA